MTTAARAGALRLGAFVLGAVVLLVATAVVLGSGGLFARHESAVLFFPGSVQGLQAGSPVVFRGVQVGAVSAVSLDVAADGSLRVPVQVKIDRRRFAPPQAEPPTVGDLVARGLVGRLASQSLLTGLQYVELDLRPTEAARPRPATVVGGLVQIPSEVGGVQRLVAQLEGLDLATLTSDLTAVAAAARRWADHPGWGESAQRLAAATASLARAAETLDRRLPALADGAQGTLDDTRAAAQAMAAAAAQLGEASAQVGAAARGAQRQLANDAPWITSVAGASEQLGRTAEALRQAAADDSAVMQNLDATLVEMRRAARSVRALADLLERHPESLVRGRPEAP